MTLYLVKIPVITGLKENVCNYDIVIEYQSHNLEYSITQPLEMDELRDILLTQDDGFVIDNFEFSRDFIKNYSKNQWQSSVRMLLWNVELEQVYPESAWTSFIIA